MLSVSLHCGVEANSWKALPDVPAEKVPAYLSPFHKVIQILQLCVHNYRQHRARLALACLFSYCHQIPSNKYSNIFIKKKVIPQNSWALSFLTNVTQTGVNSPFVWDYFQLRIYMHLVFVKENILPHSFIVLPSH